MWCKNCGKEYGTESNCPDCGEAGIITPTLSWGKTELGALSKDWPLDESGNPVAPAFLVHRSTVGMEDEMTVNFLNAYGIPAIRLYPNDGDFAKIIIGVSGVGADIYVPMTLKDDAISLLEGEIIEDEL